MTEPILYTAERTAELLGELLPERDAKKWAQWLRNSRNPLRTGYRLPSRRVRGRIYYERSDLEAFVSFERQKRLGTIQMTGRVAEVVQAFGLDKPGADGTGRPFNFSQITHQVDAYGTHFAQLLLSEPLTAYRINIEQCAALSKGLSEVMRQFPGTAKTDD